MEFLSLTNYCTMFESDDENAVGKIVLPLSIWYTYVQTYERNECWMARITISTRFPFDKRAFLHVTKLILVKLIHNFLRANLNFIGFIFEFIMQHKYCSIEISRILDNDILTGNDCFNLNFIYYYYYNKPNSLWNNQKPEYSHEL